MIMRKIYLIAVVLFFAAACKQKPAASKDSDVYYTCSMDPQVIEYKPGKCPICHMEMTPVKKSTGEKKDEIELSDQQVKLGNIRVDTIKNGTIGDEMVLTATLNFNQMKASSVSVRVSGRIEKLYYKNMGDYVKKGSPVLELYSEELNNAKQEYKLAIERKKTFTGETVIDFDQLLQSAKNKLLLWGMNESQVKALEQPGNISSTTTVYSNASGYISELEVKEGDYVMDGAAILKLADLSSLWAEAQVYTSQLEEVNEKSLATVQFPGFNGKEIKGRIEFINPEIATDTRINLLRVEIPNKDNQLKPGMPAYVILKSPARTMLSLPIDAVIRDGSGATAWIKTGTHSFKSVMVETGLESGDRLEITKGLKENDVVVISGAYLLNSEYIFRKGANPMAGHDMKNM
jgi:Cu(I)/Ag(I) efflux system membrane fusion protein